MTQRIFDIKNEKDMADLWEILPDDIIKLTPSKALNCFYGWYNDCGNTAINMLKINWHDKTEITRPIQEATEADIDKLCYFWDGDDEDCSKQIGLLTAVRTEKCTFKYVLAGSVCFAHCRRLTKQEIEELC